MVTQIQLGNFYSTGGKTVLGGAGGSGIDTQSLIKALTDAKSVPVTQLQDKIKVNDSKSAALTEFQGLLGKLRDSVSALRNAPGVGNAADNAFKYTTASVSTNTGAAGSDYLTVASSPGSALQSYTISEITSLAAAKKQAAGDADGYINIATADSAAVSTTPAAGQFKAGTFKLKGNSLTFNAGESLNSVAAKFNSISDKTGISASIIKVSTGKYQLSFSATKTGTEADFDLNDVSISDEDATVYDPDGVFTTMTVTDAQDASNAEFKFNNVAVSRQSNVITDLVDGLTFTMKQTTVSAPTTKVTVDIGADQAIAKNSIVNFINAYNDVKTFATKQKDLNADGTYKDTAVLHDSSIFNALVNDMGAQLASVVSGLADGDPSSLSDLGITFIDQAATADTPQIRNLLTVDDTKLASAIASDPDAVRKVFEFNLTTDNTALRVYSRTNALGVNEFSLNINPGTSTYQATYTDSSGSKTIDLTATPIKNSSTGVITGYSLAGKAGTVLEGLVLIYASTAAGTANVTITQGVGDKLFNIADPALKANTGSLAVELTALKDSDTRLNDNITKMNSQIEVYRQQLLDQFARLEQAVSNVNTLLQSLAANDTERTKSS